MDAEIYHSHLFYMVLSIYVDDINSNPQVINNHLTTLYNKYKNNHTIEYVYYHLFCPFSALYIYEILTDTEVCF